MLTYQRFPGIEQWTSFVHHVREKLLSWRVKYWSVTLETNKDGNAHAHLMLQFASERDTSVKDFAFNGILPNASTNDLCGEGLYRNRLQQSINRGMFYVWADKVGGASFVLVVSVRLVVPSMLSTTFPNESLHAACDTARSLVSVCLCCLRLLLACFRIARRTTPAKGMFARMVCRLALTCMRLGCGTTPDSLRAVCGVGVVSVCLCAALGAFMFEARLQNHASLTNVCSHCLPLGAYMLGARMEDDVRIFARSVRHSAKSSECLLVLFALAAYMLGARLQDHASLKNVCSHCLPLAAYILEARLQDYARIFARSVRHNAKASECLLVLFALGVYMLGAPLQDHANLTNVCSHCLPPAAYMLGPRMQHNAKSNE